MIRDKVDRLADLLLIVLVFCLPFEFRADPPHLTELQIVFVIFMAASASRIVRERRRLLSNRVVSAALFFLAIVWISALLSANTANAVKAAAR